MKLPSSLVVSWCLFHSRLVLYFCSGYLSEVVFPKSLFVYCLSCCPKIATSFCSQWSLPGGCGKYSQIRHLMANLAQNVSPSHFCFSSECSSSSTQCWWRPAHIHLGRKNILKSKRRAFGSSEGFWGHWTQQEAQFYLTFRGFLIPNFSCLHTSYPFSVQGRIGTCFYPEGGVSVCCCCAWPLSFLLMLCCLWVNLQFPSCQMSCWLHGPVVCSAYLPAVGLKPSLTRCTNAQLSHEHLHCSLHTFRHNIYNCTWPWSIALFQINDHTISFLGFCSFLFCSQNCSCAQTPGKGVL